MIVYQVSKKMFFLSNGIDYAAAVDMNCDVKLFTSQKKAEKEFDELVNSYVAVYKSEPKDIEFSAIHRAVEIKSGDIRMIIEFLKKETR